MIKTLLTAAVSAAFVLSACADGAETAEAARSITLPALVNPNTATSAELRAASGMTDTLLLDIEAARPFASGTAFAEFVRTRSDDADTVLDAVFLPLSLNSTPEDDFQLIPGVGAKMAHEFEEYRPYTSMDQFDREIGKYVDAEELARLRRYVVLD